MRLVAAVSCGVAALTTVRPAAAEQDSLGVTYDAPESGCPGRSQLIEELRARLRHTNVTPEAAGETHATVQIEQTSTGYRGVVTLDGAHTMRRELDADHCSSLLRALAVVAVISIEGTPVEVPLPEAPLPASPTVAPSRTPEPIEEPVEWQSALGLGIAARPHHLGPLGVVPRIDLSLSRRRGSERIVSALRLVLLGSVSSASEGPASADFQHLAARVELAPFEFGFASSGSPFIRPGVGFEVGHVWASGSVDPSLGRGIPARSPWLTVPFFLELGGRVRERVELTLSGGVAAGLLRPTFTLEHPTEPARPVYRAPRLLGELGLRLGVALF